MMKNEYTSPILLKNLLISRDVITASSATDIDNTLDHMDNKVVYNAGYFEM